MGDGDWVMGTKPNNLNCSGAHGFWELGDGNWVLSDGFAYKPNTLLTF